MHRVHDKDLERREGTREGGTRWRHESVVPKERLRYHRCVDRLELKQREATFMRDGEESPVERRHVQVTRKYRQLGHRKV